MTLDAAKSDAELLELHAQRTGRPQSGGIVRLPVATVVNVATVELRQIAWPFRLTLPWSHLCSDNHRYASGTARTGGGLLLTVDYRRCRGLVRDRALDALGTPHPEPAHIPLQITASVWVPDNRPHDCTNFAKVVHDGLEKIVYSNDRWLYAAHWSRAGVDVDGPRAEIEIRPLP